MGMDVMGKNPKTKEGEYFRNNIWWWHPLARYILAVAPANLTNPCRHWNSNDGDGLGARDSKALAKFLAGEIASGATAKYEADLKAKSAAIPDVPCQFCNGTGVRTDAVGVKFGMDKAGTCNACEGKGTVRPFGADEPFSVANVQEFVTFLEGCGGFEIC